MFGMKLLTNDANMAGEDIDDLPRCGWACLRGRDSCCRIGQPEAEEKTKGDLLVPGRGGAEL